MRYYPRVPLSPSSPNYPVGLSSQRSNPTCSLSLANVSASGKSSSSNNEAQEHDMEIDSLNTLVAVLPTDKRCNVPFPKRPHSLLRSTPSASRPHATSGDRSRFPVTQHCDSEEENPTHDQDPPRKRTRTSAISTSTRTRSRRVGSLPCPPPPNRPESSVTVVDQPTPVQLSRPLPPLPIPLSIPVEFPVSSDPNFSSSPPHSPSSLSSQVPSSSTPSSVPFPAGKSSPITRTAPTWSTPRRRRASPEEVASSLRLYKMLLSGLAARYGDQHDRCGMSSATAYLEAVLRDTRSYYDVQDALLAQRLRTWLVINGVDMRQVSIDIDIEKGSEEPSSSCDTPMVIDTIDTLVHLTSNTTPPENKSTAATGPQFLMTYQRHVASTLLRHQSQASSRIRGKNGKRARRASSLAVEL